MITTTAQCRSCGALIIWRNHERTGNAAPIDAEQSTAGRIVITDETYTLCMLAPRCFEPHEHYTNHFQTCPNAKTHHKARA